MKNNKIKKANSFDKLLDIKYGIIGSPKRDKMVIVIFNFQLFIESLKLGLADESIFT